MDDELKKILGGEPETPPSEGQKTTDKEPAAQLEDQELKAKIEQKANLDKAIIESQKILKENRKKIKDSKKVEDFEEEELPQINMEDPASKAWDRHIQKNVAPVAQELEKEKDEVRGFALKEFLRDHPSLARNPEKLKAVMDTYGRIKTSSERTREGVITDLEKAFAAEHSQELIDAVRSSRIDGARNDAIFSDIAVSRGSTAYTDTPTVSPQKYSDEEKAVLAKWGMTSAEHAEMKKKYG